MNRIVDCEHESRPGDDAGIKLSRRRAKFSSGPAGSVGIPPLRNGVGFVQLTELTSMETKEMERLDATGTEELAMSVCSVELERNGEPEETLVGGYSFVENGASRLGEGAYGVVYRGKDRKTGEAVAIKKMDKDQIKQEEVELVQELNSEFLVGFLDLVQMDSATYMVMELCDLDLSQHLALVMAGHEDGGMMLANLSVVLDNLARGYRVLYHEKVVHRDIKPQNILVKYAPNQTDSRHIVAAKITDFGISCVLDDSDEAISNVAGSFWYMAPEVGANLLVASGYDASVDMWSIGCVLFQCITGQVPFNERSLCRLILSAAGANFDAYQSPEIPEGNPEDLKIILRSLLEIDTKKRLSPPDFCSGAIHCSQKMISPPLSVYQ